MKSLFRRSASSRTEHSLSGLPMLMIWFLQASSAVLQNSHQCRHAVVDIGETALLAAAVHQGDRPLHQQFGDELGHHPGAAFLGRIQGIQAGSDPVERPKQGEFEMPPGAVGIDHPVQKLLAAGVDPALLLDRSDDEVAFILLEFRIGAGAVHLRGGRENHPFVILDALLDHIEIHLEIEVVDADGVLHIELRRGDRHEGKDDVAFLDVILDPLPVDRDVPFDEMEARILRAIFPDGRRKGPCRKRSSPSRPESARSDDGR